MGLGSVIGAITFSGSVVAFAKLQGLVSGKPLVLWPAFTQCYYWQFDSSAAHFLLRHGVQKRVHPDDAAGLAIGFLLILPIGGADMPVVVSMLNSYSGWAAAGIGFTLGNVTHYRWRADWRECAILLYYVAMNRSLINVIFGGFGSEGARSNRCRWG